VVPFLSIVQLKYGSSGTAFVRYVHLHDALVRTHRITPGSFRRLSFSVARTGGDVSKSMLKWLLKERKAGAVSSLCSIMGQHTERRLSL
jgi:hypothetical protein